MSVGSAFDAYIKSYIMERLFGTVPPDFEMETLLRKQVSAENLEWAREAGAHVFRSYLKSGALADLMIDLQQADGEPQFEITVQGNVAHETHTGGVPFLGKPDMFFKHKEGAHIIYDWKVNGYCGKNPTSPKKGFVNVRDGWDEKEAKPSRVRNQAHKSAQTMKINGITVNVAGYFEDVYAGWANQLSIYAWVLGEPVGSSFIVGIDQLVAIPRPAPSKPLIRVAAHRMRVSEKYQHKLLDSAANMWAIIQEGPSAIFVDEGLSPEDSIARCEVLDTYHEAFKDTGDPNDRWFNENLRGDSKPY
jgi:hypothetical protein